MDFQCLEDTKSKSKKKCNNKLSIFPVYTVAFTVNEMYDKTSINEENNRSEYPINNESASSNTLKNKESIEGTKPIVNNTIDVTKIPLISIKKSIEENDGLEYPINNESASSNTLKNKESIDCTKPFVNNTIDVTERPLIPIKNLIEENDGLEYPINNESASSNTLKNKESIDCTKPFVNNTIDVTERPLIPIKNLIEENKVLEYPINNKSASSSTLEKKESVETTKTIVNNTIDVTERPLTLINISIDENNGLKYPMNNESASSNALKTKENIKGTKPVVNNTIDVTERPIISINNPIDYSVNIKQENNSNILRPESLSSSIKYIKKPPKPKKCTQLIKIKNTYFKNKHPDNNINKKLENYYDRAKNKYNNASKIQRKINSDLILNAVSLTRILKKVLAKENLLDDIDKIYLNENHNEDGISYGSESSQHTLTRERSISSNNSSTNNTKTTPSIIDVSNYMKKKYINCAHTKRGSKTISSNISIEMDKIGHPYKTDVVAVAVAHIENASILNYKNEPSVEVEVVGREKFTVKDSLTSAESYLSQTVTETSTSSFEMLRILGKEGHLAKVGVNDSGVSSQTLTESQNVYDITSESDQFFIAQTSSFFKNDNVDSNTTLTPKVCLKNDCNVKEPNLSQTKLLKSTLLDTIINVGMYPKVSRSNPENIYNTEWKDVIITDELRNSLPLNRLENDIHNENKYSKSIFKKSFNVEDDSNRQTNISLPNEETIKELLFNRTQEQKKTCSEEFRNYTPFSELWDKLTVFLDVTMKKMEEAITDKITQEMKRTLDKLDRYINTLKEDSKMSKSEIDLKNESIDANVIGTMESGQSKSLQCGSIQNNVLDELIKKINLEELKVFKCPALKLKGKCKRSDDFFEVLKPTSARCDSNEKRNGDSIVASSEAIEIKYSKLQYLPMFMKTIVRFFKENLIVITSVPVFCFSLFLMYTFLVMLANI